MLLETLPIRADKRFITKSVANSNPDYRLLTAAKRPAIAQWAYIDIPSRGVHYTFIINPGTLNISRQTVDAQSLTHSGWQMSVWGEDLVKINLSGKTPGQYFGGVVGLTENFREFSLSYRNLCDLEVVFENNGYYFEGEQSKSSFAPDYTRRRIKMHEDVIFSAGNFSWYGIFESMTITREAESPFTSSFSLSFTAWKERYSNNSPYYNAIPNNVERGHAYGVYKQYGASQIAKATISTESDVLNASKLGQLLKP